MDDREITATQFDAMMADATPADEAEAKSMRKQGLSRLINESLLVAKAESLKLDREPAVAREINAARRTLLARAYLARAATPPVPSDVAVARYYNEHAYLFAQRRRYVLARIAVEGTPADLAPIIKHFSAPGSTLDTVKSDLAARRVDSVTDSVTVDADELPEALARQLQGLAVGDSVTFRLGSTQQFVRIIEASVSPVPLRLASPRIVQQLTQNAGTALAAAEIDRLRAAAKVELRPVGRTIMSAAAGKM